MLKTSLLFYKIYKLQGSSVSQPLYADPVYLFTICLFIFLCKYDCKIDHKNKSSGNYTKLTNKRKNHRK